MSIDLLVPGMMVNARVRSTLENGVMLSFLTYFTGTVSVFVCFNFLGHILCPNISSYMVIRYAYLFQIESWNIFSFQFYRLIYFICKIVFLLQAGRMITIKIRR